MCAPDLFSKIEKLFIFLAVSGVVCPACAHSSYFTSLPCSLKGSVLHRQALCTRLLFKVHGSAVSGKVLISYTVSKSIGKQGPLPNSRGYIISKRYNAHLGYIAIERNTVNLHVCYTTVERLTVHLSYIAIEKCTVQLSYIVIHRCTVQLGYIAIERCTVQLGYKAIE
jgi:hypothetical protein